MKKSFNNSSASHFGDLVILVDLTPVPNIKFQNPQQGTWLVCRRGWFGILFLRTLIGWSRLTPVLNIGLVPWIKRFQKIPFEFLQTYPSSNSIDWRNVWRLWIFDWQPTSSQRRGKPERNWSTRKSWPSHFSNFASRMMFHNSKKCLQPNGKYSLKEACKERKQEHTVRKTFLGKSCVFFWDLLLRILGEVGKLLLVRRTSFFPPVGEKPRKLCWTLFSYFTHSKLIWSLEINQTDEIRTKYVQVVVYVKSLDEKKLIMLMAHFQLFRSSKKNLFNRKKENSVCMLLSCKVRNLKRKAKWRQHIKNCNEESNLKFPFALH